MAGDWDAVSYKVQYLLPLSSVWLPVVCWLWKLTRQCCLASDSS